MSITNPGVKWVCALSFACAEAVQGHSLASLTGGMIPGPGCEHTHLSSRSSVPLFRTNRYIKHSILWVGKVWDRTLGWDKLGRQLVYFVLYLYFSLTFATVLLSPPPTLSFPMPCFPLNILPPHPPSIPSLPYVTERKKLALIFISSAECDVDGRRIVSGMTNCVYHSAQWPAEFRLRSLLLSCSVRHAMTKAAIHLRRVKN